MTSLTFAVAALLCAPPLSVRLLEQQRPTRAWLEAERASCDGQPVNLGTMGRGWSLAVSGQQVAVGPSKRCTLVETSGQGFTLKVGELKRRYRGNVSVRVIDAQLAFFEEADVEGYLLGVVGSEGPAGAPEALKAQAVVSRTFALAERGRHRKAGYDLCDLTHCQLYRGREDETPAASEAVRKTEGEVLRVGGVVLAPTFFHAACGGSTSSAEEIFGEEGQTAAVGCTLCTPSPDFAWQWRIERPELAAALGLPNQGAAFVPLHRDAGGRVLEVLVFGRRMTGSELLGRVGRAFGYQQLKSMKVSAQEANAVLLFTGNGRGHGVGLCQAGAKAMAEGGASAAEILKRYFPTSEIKP